MKLSYFQRWESCSESTLEVYCNSTGEILTKSKIHIITNKRI